ncbi:MAG: hypothetical protein WCO71_04765 [Pseudomonadota bacterium]
MIKFSSLVLLGCSLMSGVAFAQDDVRDVMEIHIGEMLVWDCARAAPPGVCRTEGFCIYEEAEWVAERVQERMGAMSAIHWSLGPIIQSPTGSGSPAIFSIGVFEGSRIPEIDEIVGIGRSAAQCGELVVGPYHYPF